MMLLPIEKRLSKSLRVFFQEINGGKGKDMAINFYPNREQLSKEIDQCVASRKREVLLSFCRCCVYNIFDESTIVTECFKCGIQHGILKMSKALQGTDTPDLEFLGVC